MLKGNILARCIRQIVIISVLAAALASCRGNDGGGLLSRGDLYPNGTETFGSVVEGGECFYVLRNIKAGGSYTLRTQIAPGGTVQMHVYTSEAAYKNGQLPIPVETPVYPLPPNDIIHEAVFTPLTSGDYVVVLRGTAEDLLPEVAILFNDTQLRMKDKLVVLFEDELRRRYGKESGVHHPVERLAGELFHVGHRIFIVNSKKDAAENFSIS